MRTRALALALPPRPFFGSIVARTVLLWLFVRAAASGAGAAMGMGGQPFLGLPISGLWVYAVVIAALRVEMWRQGELVFLANLGHSFLRVAGVTAGVCLLLEVGTRTVFG